MRAAHQLARSGPYWRPTRSVRGESVVIERIDPGAGSAAWWIHQFLVMRAVAGWAFNRWNTVQTSRMGRAARNTGGARGLPLDNRAEGESVVDYKEKLRRLALNDPSLLDGRAAGELGSVELEPRTLALVQLAALIAVGGAVPSYGELADAAVGSGVTAAEVVDVLAAVIPIVGLPLCRRGGAQVGAGARVRHERGVRARRLPVIVLSAEEPDRRRRVDGFAARRHAELPVDRAEL